MKRPPPIYFLAIPVVVVFLGLSEVGWRWSALPSWYLAAAVLCTFLAFAGSRVMERATPERPVAQRIWLMGLSWGVPVSALLLSTDLLGERLTGPNLLSSLALRLIFLMLMSLTYGSIMAYSQRRGA